MPSTKSRSKSGKPGGSKPEITIIDIVEQQRKDAEANFRRALGAHAGTMSFKVKPGGTLDHIPDEASAANALPTWQSYKGPALDNTASEVTHTSDPSHTVEDVTSAISTLQSLEETLPGIVHAANALGGRGFNATPHDTVGSIAVAVRMLAEYRRRIDAEARRRNEEQAQRAAQMAYEVGVQTGIDQEKARAKEAKRGRKH